MNLTSVTNDHKKKYQIDCVCELELLERWQVLYCLYMSPNVIEGGKRRVRETESFNFYLCSSKRTVAKEKVKVHTISKILVLDGGFRPPP